MKQRGRLVGFARKTLSNPGNVGWILILLLVAVLVYPVMIAYFNLRGERRQAFEFHPPSPSPSATPLEPSSFAIILNSIDLNARTIAFDVETAWMPQQAPAQLCVAFYYFLPEIRFAGASYERMAGVSYELVTLEEARRGLFSQDLQNKGGRGLRGSGTFKFDSDQRHFPLDSIPLEISLYAKCLLGPAPLTSNDVKILFVENRIRDYQLTGQQDIVTPNFTLRRTPFLIYLSVLLLLLAFVSALVIIAEARSKPLDLKLLTYFIGLWGIRSILLTPVQNVSAFPTLIEVTILFLFGFTAIGIGLMRFLATRKKPDKFDWSRL